MLGRKEGCEPFGCKSQRMTVARKFGKTSRQCGLMFSGHISYSG